MSGSQSRSTVRLPYRRGSRGRRGRPCRLGAVGGVLGPGHGLVGSKSFMARVDLEEAGCQGTGIPDLAGGSGGSNQGESRKAPFLGLREMPRP